MEPATAVASFVGLAGSVARSLKLLYDFATDMEDCPKDIREMKTDLELMEGLIEHVIQQCDKRDKRLGESAALKSAITRAQESVEDLKKKMNEYMVDGRPKRFHFAAKIHQTKKLRTSLDRAKTTMLQFKEQLQSDVAYDTRDTAEEVLRIVDRTDKRLQTYDKNLNEALHRLQIHTFTTNESKRGVEPSVRLASDTSNEGLTAIEDVGKKLQHITELLTPKCTSSSPASAASTPILSREVSDAPDICSSQSTTARSIAGAPSFPLSISQDNQQAGILSEHPLVQFKNNKFAFVMALIFVQRTPKKQQRLACQRASECLEAYPTPEALSKASAEALGQYFDGIGLHNTKPPQLIKLAKVYVMDPPRAGVLRSKKKCPQSEISHLPQIGELSIIAWQVYYCGRVDIMTEDQTLLDYMEHLRNQTRLKSNSTSSSFVVRRAQ